MQQTKLRTQDEIVKDWPADAPPLVSISCMTYNHEPYIADAIEGFLLQETDFPFQILVHDDASTDKTAEIVREYEERYPRLIRPYYRTENCFGKPDRFERMAEFRNWHTGKYIAKCEGDDYWTDPHKLKKQVEIMEANPEVGFVHGGYREFTVADGTVKTCKHSHCITLSQKGRELCEQILTEEYFGRVQCIRTCTVCFRRDLFSQVQRNVGTGKFMMGDIPLFLEMSMVTDFAYIDDEFGTYRVRGDSACQRGDPVKRLAFLMSGYEMREHYLQKHGFGENTWVKVLLPRCRAIIRIAVKAGRKRDAAIITRRLSESLQSKHTGLNLKDKSLLYIPYSRQINVIRLVLLKKLNRMEAD